MSMARRLLGHAYTLTGSVVTGHGIGSKQTVPTLNIEPATEVLPPDGVYITRTREVGGERKWDSITNIGLRPTFDGERRTIETYLLDAFDGRRPAGIAVELLRRVREERKFETAEALKTQIFRDVARAQAYHRRLARWRPGLQ